MGNRGGALHNDAREIVRQAKGRRWLTCLLEFKGIRRAVMSPHRYTELFFLDEAVAFAAGHRPCAECRRGRFLAFQHAWIAWRAANPAMPLSGNSAFPAVFSAASWVQAAPPPPLRGKGTSHADEIDASRVPPSLPFSVLPPRSPRLRGEDTAHADEIAASRVPPSLLFSVLPPRSPRLRGEDTAHADEIDASRVPPSLLFSVLPPRSPRLRGEDTAHADEIDAELHRHRIGRHGAKIIWQAPLETLPNGCFVAIGQSFHLVWNDALLLWSPERYAARIPRPAGSTVTVLTPRPIVECFRHGYQPEIHASWREL